MLRKKLTNLFAFGRSSSDHKKAAAVKAPIGGVKKEFDYTNVNDVSDVMQDLREIEDKYPKVMAFLEWYCGFTRPTSGRVAEEICYDQGKRDVILIIKTLQRTDIDPAVVVNEFKRNREGEF